ncbi:MAG: hypothetical protein Q4B26_02315 [Eubacteriales bacterium]|nr:hypothetical protein [Eubacteriales bacterium]
MLYDRIQRMIDYYQCGDENQKLVADELLVNVIAVIDAYRITNSLSTSDVYKREYYMERGKRALEKINELSGSFYAGYLFNPTIIRDDHYLLEKIAPLLMEEQLYWSQKPIGCYAKGRNYRRFAGRRNHLEAKKWKKKRNEQIL